MELREAIWGRWRGEVPVGARSPGLGESGKLLLWEQPDIRDPPGATGAS